MKHIGYEGPVVCEPFNRRFHKLSVEDAVKEVKESMDACFLSAQSYRLADELVGTQPYNPDPMEAKVRAGGLSAEGP